MASKLKKDLTRDREVGNRISGEIQLVKDYETRSHLKGIDRALVILKRYNLPWSRHRSVPFDQLPVLRYIRSIAFPQVECLITRALRSPLFYRLNYIKQLGTVCYTRNLDASHHRLPHALGTAETAGEMVRCLNEKAPADLKVTENERDAVILYALVHDCYQGPLGHTLEPLRNVLVQDNIRRLDKYFLGLDLKNEGELVKSINYIFEGTPEKAKKIIDLMLFLVKPKVGDARYRSRFFLTQIVDSQIDADRFDYLYRDGIHLGQGKTDKGFWVSVLKSVKIAPEASVRQGATPRQMIAFPEEKKDIINDILDCRHRFYNEYYEHPDKLALDEMICHVVYYYLNDILKTPSDKKEEFFHEFMKLTDANLFPFLMELEGDFYVQDMINDILTNRHFKVINIEGVSPDELDKLKGELTKFSKEYEGQIATSGFIAGDESIPAEERIALLLSASAGAQTSYKAKILLLTTKKYGDFEDKILLEEKLWRSLLGDPEIEQIWNDILIEQYGFMAQEAQKALAVIPQIHITFPLPLANIPKGRETLVHHMREAPLRADYPFEKILYYDEHGATKWIETDIRTAKTFEGQAVIFSAQCDLAANPRFREIAMRKFEEMVNSWEWWIKGKH